MHSVPFVDSHTAGEPTRVILEVPFDLGSGSLAERREIFAAKYDNYRSAFCTEPRAGDTTVGALLVPPSDPTCSVGAEASQFSARSSTAGTAIIGASGAEHEVTAIGDLRRSKQLDMIDLLRFWPKRERFPNAETIIGQLFAVFQSDFQAVIFDQEKPISAPGDIACYLP